MSGYYFLNEDFTYKPCDLMTWAKQIEELTRIGKKHVNDEIFNGKRISTVWLGLDHNHFGGRPLLFETMIFNEEGRDIYCDRYTTYEEAKEGHKRAIQWVLDGCKDDIQ